MGADVNAVSGSRIDRIEAAGFGVLEVGGI
jgi:hypothetical protein